MSEATLHVSTQSRHRKAHAAATPLDRVRRIGYAAIAIQLSGFLIWSTVLYHRFALTFDFSVIDQAWWQIAHGTLNPRTLENFPYWQDHSNFMIWPLSVLYWIWPQDTALLWLQDLCIAAAELMAFSWICRIASRRTLGMHAAWISGTGLVLLVANPWIWWAVSFDFHIESVALLFAVLVLRDLSDGRRRAWVWVLPLLACGDVAGTYLAGAGLGSALTRRNSRTTAVTMTVVGVGAVILITLVHGNRGSGGGLGAYKYLTEAGPVSAPLSLLALARGVFSHPVNVITALWSKRTDIVANLAPSGLLGLADLAVSPLIIVIVLANTLFEGLKFAEPIFQYLPVYMVMPVGTVVVLRRVAARRGSLAIAACCLLVAQAVGWAAVWGPKTSSQWLRVSAPAASTLASVAAKIPTTADVVVSEGVIGRFSHRVHLQSLAVPGPIYVYGKTWIVIAPLQGIEIQSVSSAMALIDELAGSLHARLITHANGIWAFTYTPPAGRGQIMVPLGSSGIPAWASPTAPGSVGSTALGGAVDTWHLESTRQRGYVDDELGWRVRPGIYRVVVRLRASGSVNVEVWNDNGDILLTRRTVSTSGGAESISLPVDATISYSGRLFDGWGPFRVNFVPAPPGEFLEVRIWSPGIESVSIYSARIMRQTSSR